MRLITNTLGRNQKGFTLVELLVVLSIMVVALAAVFQFLFFTQNSYARADARSAVIQETDLLFLQLEKDIRSASEPNDSTKSVRVLNNGEGIDIYSHKDSQYHRISYRKNGSELQRGFVSTTTKSNSQNPTYGDITNWKTIVSNLMPGNAMIFDDSRNVDISIRRLIDVNVYVQHPDLDNAIHAQTSLMSRTGKSTASIEAYNAEYSYKEVAYIKFFDKDNNEITTLNIGRSGGVINITARAFAADGTIATNQNLLLQQNFTSISWATFPGYSFLSENGLLEVINNLDLNLDGYRDRYVARSGQSVSINTNNYPWIWKVFRDTRTARIKAISPDGVEATLTINQNYNT